MGNEPKEWQHDEVEDLLQQLHNEKERCDAYLDDVKRLEQQLVAALAACKMKDEFIRLLQDHFSVSVFGKMVIQEALIIQPDDTALKAWIRHVIRRSK